MKNSQKEIIDFKIDLSFTDVSKKEFKTKALNKTNNVFQDSEFWKNQFYSWMYKIKSNSSFHSLNQITKIKSFGIGLQFTDDISITKLNYKWLGKNKSTDVLSFPVYDKNLILPDLNYAELGDIVVSLETADRQANEFSRDFIHELTWLVSHGFLHLLGWDHPDNISLEKMLAFQNYLIDNKDIVNNFDNQ